MDLLLEKEQAKVETLGFNTRCRPRKPYSPYHPCLLCRWSAPPAPEPGFARSLAALKRAQLEAAARALDGARAAAAGTAPFAALEERHRFLVTQLEDVKNSRTDLRNIIRQVDQHVEEVFAEAYRDTAEQFVSVFATLFPGGEGRLRLTDPDDLLNSGVEV